MNASIGYVGTMSTLREADSRGIEGSGGGEARAKYRRECEECGDSGCHGRMRLENGVIPVANRGGGVRGGEGDAREGEGKGEGEGERRRFVGSVVDAAREDVLSAAGRSPRAE